MSCSKPPSRPPGVARASRADHAAEAPNLWLEVRVLGATLAAPIVLSFDGELDDLADRAANILDELPEGDRVEVWRDGVLLTVTERPRPRLH